MIRGTRVEITLTYSQTSNGRERSVVSVNLLALSRISSGPFLVSRTGDAG